MAGKCSVREYSGMGMIIFIAVVVLLGLIAVGIYNRLVGLRQTCRQGNADIDAQLRQRSDLIPNLVETVKGYAAHEQDTLEQVIAARNAAASSGSPAAEQALSGALGKLLALGEAYPELKANTNFQALQGELADTEDKLVKRIEHDLEYIENWSLALDLYILIKTPLSLLKTENAY